METFAEPKAFVENPHFKAQRQRSLQKLNDAIIDAPIIDIVHSFNNLPFCFTLQSCYGHFLYEGQEDPRYMEPLPAAMPVDKVEYRIAYVAFCIDCCNVGQRFLTALGGFSKIDNENIQLCSAEWFWKKQVNSYALQVEPQRFKELDTAILDFEEALHIEKLRNAFFAELRKLLRKQQG